MAGKGEDIAYPWAVIERILRTPLRLDVETGGSQINLQQYIRYFETWHIKPRKAQSYDYVDYGDNNNKLAAERFLPKDLWE